MIYKLRRRKGYWTIILQMEFWLKTIVWHSRWKHWRSRYLCCWHNYKILIIARFNPWSVIFVEVIIQTVIVPFRIIHLKNRSITWAIREGKVGFPTIIIILKDGEAIIIKFFGGNKMLVNLTSKTLFNNNNHYILQFRREQTNWKILWRNLCKHHSLIKVILTL